MRRRTLAWLVLVASALGGYIFFIDRRLPDHQAFSWVARRGGYFRADRVEAFDLEIGDRRFRGERDGESWRLTYPVNAPADPAAVESMLAGFEGLTCRSTISRKERLEQGLELEDFGLDRPRARWTLWVEGERHRLWLGKPAAAGPFVYLFDEETEEVVCVSDSVQRLIPQSAKDLRERRLFPDGVGRLQRIELTRPDGFVQLVCTEPGEWRIQQPYSARADAGAVQTLVSRLLNGRVQSFVRDGPGDDAAFGFTETGISVSLIPDRMHAPAFRLDIGLPVPDRPSERYARVGQEKRIVTISEEMVRPLQTKVNHFRDRRLLPFEIDSIQGVEIIVGSERLELVREDDGRWSIVFPGTGPADQDTVQRLLRTWTGTRIERFLPDETPEPEVGRDRRIVFHVLERDAVEGSSLRRVALALEPPDPEGLIPLRFLKEGGERVAVHPLRLKGCTADPLTFAAQHPLVLDPDALRGFTTRHAGEEWTVTVQDSGALVLHGDGFSVVFDEQTARSQRELLLNLPVTGPVSFGSAFLAEQGLDDPKTLIRIHLSDKAGLGRTVSLGREGPDGVFVRVGGQDLTYTMDPALAEILRRKPFADEPDG